MRLFAAKPVSQREAVREQIECVVGVEVADQDRVDRQRIRKGTQLREDAPAAFEQQRETGVRDQITALRAACVRHCRRLAKHR